MEDSRLNNNNTLIFEIKYVLIWTPLVNIISLFLEYYFTSCPRFSFSLENCSINSFSSHPCKTSHRRHRKVRDKWIQNWTYICRAEVTLFAEVITSTIIPADVTVNDIMNY